MPLAKVLAEEIFLTVGVKLPTDAAPPVAGDIHLKLDPKLKGDNYTLTVTDRATVTAGNYNGAAFGTTTLLQLLQGNGANVTVPRVAIDDGPQVPYCATMIDIARKFHPIDSLKQAVRVCRFYKIRYIQLHMTDDQAWMFPSKSFPQLGKHNGQQLGPPQPPYKLEDLRELVAYADARGVTLVPELESPGHSGQMRGTLPEIFQYRQDDGSLSTQETINLVSEKSFDALDKIIGEMAEVFRSSPYLHVGFDEASITGIENLDEVKAFMVKHKMTHGHEVLNYFQNRVQEIARKHGKRMSVWDAALGPVPPAKDLIVSVWNPGGGADVPVSKGYAVNQAPWSAPGPYFDPHKVNSVDLKHGDPLMHGAISLIWEQPPESALQFLRYIAALRNEPTYNPATGRGLTDFLMRHRAGVAKLDRLLAGFTFEAKGLVDALIYMRPDPMFEDEAVADIATSLKAEDIRFTLDGAEPTASSPRWAGPITIRKTTMLKARHIGADAPGDALTLAVPFRKAPALKHDARGAAVTIEPNNPGYFGPGAKGMTDGFLAVDTEAAAPGWVGWNGVPVEITLDLKKPTAITRLTVHCMRAAGGIDLPKEIQFAISDDGKTFKPLATVSDSAAMKVRGWYNITVRPVKARYIKATCIQSSHWIFIDEVAVNAAPIGPNLRHAAVGKPVTLSHEPPATYSLSGVTGLTDGYAGPTADFLNPEWLGLEAKPIEATIDLGEAMDIRKVGANFLQYTRAGIYIPTHIDVLVSDDGKEFKKVGEAGAKREARPTFIETLSADLKDVKARYVRLVAPTNGAWLFIDEVFVNPP